MTKWICVYRSGLFCVSLQCTRNRVYYWVLSSNNAWELSARWARATLIECLMKSTCRFLFCLRLQAGRQRIWIRRDRTGRAELWMKAILWWQWPWILPLNWTAMHELSFSDRFYVRPATGQEHGSMMALHGAINKLDICCIYDSVRRSMSSSISACASTPGQCSAVSINWLPYDKSHSFPSWLFNDALSGSRELCLSE